jgi:hypothetical protein
MEKGKIDHRKTHTAPAWSSAVRAENPAIRAVAVCRRPPRGVATIALLKAAYTMAGKYERGGRQDRARPAPPTWRRSWRRRSPAKTPPRLQRRRRRRRQQHDLARQRPVSPRVQQLRAARAAARRLHCVPRLRAQGRRRPARGCSGRRCARGGGAAAQAGGASGTQAGYQRFNV